MIKLKQSLNKKPTKKDINKIIKKILSLPKHKEFTIGKFLRKFDLTQDEKNTYAKQIHDRLFGYVEFISGGSYSYDTLPCSRNDMRVDRSTLKKILLISENDHESESLEMDVNKSKLQEIVNNFNIDYTSNTISIEELERFEKIISCKFGVQLREYLLKYGYMGYESIEFYGINSKQLEKSDMIVKTLYLHENFPKTKDYVAFESESEHNFALIDSEDRMHYYNDLTDEMVDSKSKLYDFILGRLKYISTNK